jgi:hypothetical protein
LSARRFVDARVMVAVRSHLGARSRSPRGSSMAKDRPPATPELSLARERFSDCERLAQRRLPLAAGRMQCSP